MGAQVTAVDKEEQISIENFRMWQNDPVTVAMMGFFTGVRDYIERGMLDPSVVLKDGGQIEYARAVGMRDSVDMILHLQIEDLIEVDSDGIEGEQLDTSGLQD